VVAITNSPVGLVSVFYFDWNAYRGKGVHSRKWKISQTSPLLLIPQMEVVRQDWSSSQINGTFAIGEWQVCWCSLHFRGVLTVRNLLEKTDIPVFACMNKPYKQNLFPSWIFMKLHADSYTWCRPRSGPHLGYAWNPHVPEIWADTMLLYRPQKY